MSQENVEIVRRCAEVINRCDISEEIPSALLELADPGVELDLSRNVFNPILRCAQ